MQSTSTPTFVSTVTNSVPCALAGKLLRALSRSVALSLALALGLSLALFYATASALTPTPLENQLDAIVYSPTAAELFWPRAATGTEYFVTENVAGLALDQSVKDQAMKHCLTCGFVVRCILRLQSSCSGTVSAAGRRVAT